MARFDPDCVRSLQEELNRHPVYKALEDLSDLRVFMGHHVYSVWDFMSLIKYLQGKLAPVQLPWAPTGSPRVRYFINQLVVEEESDEVTLPGGGITYASHFETYCTAMQEVGANHEAPRRFIELVRENGLDKALYSEHVPTPARYFCETTFCFIHEDKPHEVAAALAMGRERVIPEMFRRFLEHMNIDEEIAPSFHAYLKRHIYLDQDFHGPLSLELLNELCAGDSTRVEEAETVAEEALCARIRFWDGVLETIKSKKAA